jgi:hypothetical protein
VVRRRRVAYWHEGMPVSPRRPVRRPWQEPKAADLPPLPAEWTPLLPGIHREWAEPYAAARSTQLARAYAWHRQHFFKQWEDDEIEWADRELREGAPLQSITIYPPKERHSRNFKIERGHVVHIPSGRIHYDPHYRRRPELGGAVPPTSAAARSRQTKAEVEKARKRIEAIQRDRQRCDEDFADRKELKEITGLPKALLEKAQRQVSPSLKRKPGQHRKQPK